MLKENDKLYHAEELAEFLGSPSELIYWMIENEALTPVWIGEEPWFPKRDLDILFDELNLAPKVH
jgi:hypothetical protein